jgi:hypothetical protein
MAPDCSLFPLETCCFADLSSPKSRIAGPGGTVIRIELCLLYNPAGSVQSAFLKRRKYRKIGQKEPFLHIFLAVTDRENYLIL